MHFPELFVKIMIVVSLGLISVSVVVLVVLLIVDLIKQRVW